MTEKQSYVLLKQRFLRGQNTFPFDIFVHLSDQKVIKVFSKNAELGIEELGRLDKYPPTNVLIRKNDFLAFIENKKKKFAAEVKAGDEVSMELKKEMVSNAFNVDPNETAEEKIEGVIGESKEVINSLLKNQSQFDFKFLLSVLNNMENETDLFKVHASQVSSISMMIAQIVPNVTMENINEVGVAAAIHAMGLQFLHSPELLEIDHTLFDVKALPEDIDFEKDKDKIQKVIKKHFDGHEDLNKEEQELYLKHLDFIKKIPMAPKYRHLFGVNRTLDDFKHLQMANSGAGSFFNPYISAKILVIGDRLLGHLKGMKQGETVVDVLDKMEAQTVNNDIPIWFDPKMMRLFREALNL